MDKSFSLEKITGYAVHTSNDNGEEIKLGMYKDQSVANVKALNAGLWGENGVVTILDNLYIDSNEELYELRPIGKFKDDESRAEMIEAIKSKLTKDELELLLGGVPEVEKKIIWKPSLEKTCRGS